MRRLLVLLLVLLPCCGTINIGTAIHVVDTHVSGNV